MPFFVTPDNTTAFVDVDATVVQKHASDTPYADISVRIGPACFALSERAVEVLRSAGLLQGLELNLLAIEHEAVGEVKEAWSGPTYYAAKAVDDVDAIDHEATQGRSSGEPPAYRRINSLVVRVDRLPTDRAVFRLSGSRRWSLPTSSVSS